MLVNKSPTFYCAPKTQKISNIVGAGASVLLFAIAIISLSAPQDSVFKPLVELKIGIKICLLTIATTGLVLNIFGVCTLPHKNNSVSHSKLSPTVKPNHSSIVQQSSASLPSIQEGVNVLQENPFAQLRHTIYQLKEKPSLFEPPALQLTIPPQAITRLKQLDLFGTTLAKKLYCEGGRHRVFFLPEAPDLVFKVPLEKFKTRDANYANYFVQRERLTNTAIDLCRENNLFLLEVPRTGYLPIGKKYFIVQKRLALGDGSLHFQQSVWTALVEAALGGDAVLEKYVKLLLKQSIQLSLRINLCDIKYDNIPITLQGHVAFPDLDECGDPCQGIAKGIIPDRNYGLFKIVPSAWFEEIYAFACDEYHVLKTQIENHFRKQSLTEGQMLVTVIRLIGDKNKWLGKKDQLQAIMQRRELKRQRRRELLQAKNVTQITDAVNLSNEKLTNEVRKNHARHSTFHDLITARRTSFFLHECFEKNDRMTPQEKLTFVTEILDNLQSTSQVIYKIKRKENNLLDSVIVVFA